MECNGHTEIDQSLWVLRGLMLSLVVDWSLLTVGALLVPWRDKTLLYFH